MKWTNGGSYYNCESYLQWTSKLNFETTNDEIASCYITAIIYTLITTLEWNDRAWLEVVHRQLKLVTS